MKNKRIKILAILSVVSLLTACGGGENEKTEIKEEKLSILPSRIEQIDQGGVIPEGHEADVESESEYTLEMLWGNWVLKGSKDQEVHISNETINIGDGETEEAVEVECFPARMSFNPAWAGVYTEFGNTGRKLAVAALAEEQLALNQQVSVFDEGDFYTQYVMENINSAKIEEPLGEFLESIGYGIGGIEFQATVDGDGLSALAYGDRKIAYAIHDNTLAIGVTDASLVKDLNETDILEIDYEMELKGYELHLTYGDETAVYVPEQIEGTVNYQGFYIDKAGISPNYKEIDHIKGITLIPDEDYLISSYGTDAAMFDIHEGYVETAFDFKEDGTVTIHSSKGDIYEYEYYYSGDALTLMSEEETAVYSIYDYKLEAQNATPYHRFKLNGNSLRMDGRTTLVQLCEEGLQTNIDLSQPVESGQVTDEITLRCQGEELTVKVGNPYEYPVEIGKALICYYRLDQDGSVITTGDGTKIGVSTYDQVDHIYAPYEKNENMLRYVGTSAMLRGIDSFEYAHHSVVDVSHNLEVIYEFENGILSRVIMENPSLLYNGLHDNVDRSLLAQMKPEEFSGVMQIRNTILDALKASFAEAGISVNINEKTGEILMDNDVLFGVDEYELSSEGKQYIDSFMGVYASVITADEFSDYISKVLFEGHTDSSGSYGYNLVLSQKRADSVLNYCMDSSNNRMDDGQKAKLHELATAIGHSSSDPILTEDGKEDMDASRRVAIKFYINVNDEAVENNTEESADTGQSENALEVDNAELSEVIDTTTEQTVSDSSLDAYFALLNDSTVILMGESGEEPMTWTLPMPVETFSYGGWEPMEGLDCMVEPGYRTFQFNRGESVFFGYVFNRGESASPLKQCEMIGIIIEKGMNSNIGLNGKITLNSTAEEIKAAYGNPSESIEEAGYLFINYADNATVHFKLDEKYGVNNSILYIAPGYSYTGENFFYELIDAEQ